MGKFRAVSNLWGTRIYGTCLRPEMSCEERSALITERDLQLSLAPGTHNLLLEVKGLLRHSPMLSRLEHHQIVALLEGAEVQELRLGDVEGPLRGVSLLLSRSARSSENRSNRHGLSAVMPLGRLQRS